MSARWLTGKSTPRRNADQCLSMWSSSHASWARCKPTNCESNGKGILFGAPSPCSVRPGSGSAAVSASRVMRGSSQASCSASAAAPSACHCSSSPTGSRLTARRCAASAVTRLNGSGSEDGAYRLGPGCATHKSSTNATGSGAWSPSSGGCSTARSSKSND